MLSRLSQRYAATAASSVVASASSAASSSASMLTLRSALLTTSRRHISIADSPITSKLTDKSLLRDAAYIDGKWANAASGKKIKVYSPTTSKLIGTIPDLSASEVDSAIKAAEKAFPAWAALTAKARADILMKWYDLIIKHQVDLGTILTMEQGKPMAEAQGEVVYGAGFFQVYAGEAERVQGEILQPSNPTTKVLTFRQPVGVVAAITPWNFPAAMITRKCGAALAAGCTVVLKPSEFTPYSAFALAELAERAGLPKGCFNLVTGDASTIGTQMTSSKVVKKLTFTGSTRVGKLLLKQCADTVKRTSMELGGNAPYIVFNDADIEAALNGLIVCKYRNSGQTCVTANRIFVQSEIYDKFAAKLVERVKALKQGAGIAAGVNVGPLINSAAVDKVHAQVKDAVSKGAKVLIGGKPASAANLAGEVDAKLFYEPTVITGVTQDMVVAQEETFGPVGFLFKFETEEEVIQHANNVDAGLAGYFFTSNASRIWRMSEKLHYGMIGANSGSISSTTAPFGGVKESGFGREGSHHGLTDYLDIKAVHMNI